MGFDLGAGIGICDWGLILEFCDGNWGQALGLRRIKIGIKIEMGNRLKITFKLEGVFVGCWVAGLVRKYHKLHLTLFLQYSRLD